MNQTEIQAIADELKINCTFAELFHSKLEDKEHLKEGLQMYIDGYIKLEDVNDPDTTINVSKTMQSIRESMDMEARKRQNAIDAVLRTCRRINGLDNAGKNIECVFINDGHIICFGHCDHESSSTVYIYASNMPEEVELFVLDNKGQRKMHFVKDPDDKNKGHYEFDTERVLTGMQNFNWNLPALCQRLKNVTNRTFIRRVKKLLCEEEKALFDAGNNEQHD